MWTEVPSALNYDLKVNDGGGWEVIDTTTRSRSTKTLAPGTYEWEVRTNFANSCDSTYSVTRSLVITPAAECPTEKPELVSPAAGASDLTNPVHFDWQPVTGAVNYRLFVTVDGGAITLLTTTTGTDHTATINGTSVLWTVEATFAENNCPNTRAEARRFTIKHECADAEIGLLTPAKGATVGSPVTLSWTPVANATSYRVWIALGDSAPVNIIKVVTTSTVLNLPSGRINWYVEALRNDCDPVVSDHGDFTVRGGDCANKPAPALIAPIGTAAAPVPVTNPVGGGRLDRLPRLVEAQRRRVRRHRADPRHPPRAHLRRRHVRMVRAGAVRRLRAGVLVPRLLHDSRRQAALRHRRSGHPHTRRRLHRHLARHVPLERRRERHQVPHLRLAGRR
jgi:hypothetical protein